MQRDLCVDALKGVCMVLVVFGHCPEVGTWAAPIKHFVHILYTFHTSIFIFLSGWFFSSRSGGRDEYVKILMRVVKPYLVAACVLWFATRACGGDLSLVAVLTGQEGIGGLWFLYDLSIFQFCTLSAITIGQKLGLDEKVRLVLQLIIGGWFAILIFSMFNRILPAYFFVYFYVGFYGRKVLTVLPGDWMFLLVAALSFFTLDVSRGSLGNVVWVLSLCFGGLGLIQQHKGSRIICSLATVGRHSMVILLFHPLFVGVVKKFSAVFLFVDRSGLFCKVVACMVAVVGCILLENVLDRLRIKKVVL